jgi:hypothetical protein
MRPGFESIFGWLYEVVMTDCMCWTLFGGIGAAAMGCGCDMAIKPCGIRYEDVRCCWGGCWYWVVVGMSLSTPSWGNMLNVFAKPGVLSVVNVRGVCSV